MALSKIKTNSIADNAITSTKIGVDVIVAEDLASNSITVAEIASGAVTTAKLATDLVVTHALGSASTPSITFTGDTNTGIFSPAADTLAFAEGGAEVARFDSSANLGIGTTSPVEKLTVSGAVSLNTDLVLKEGTTARGYIFGTSAGLNYRATSGLPHIFQNVGTELMRITSGGLVGINNTAPATALDIGGTGTLTLTNQNAAGSNGVATPGNIVFSGAGWNTNLGSVATYTKIVPFFNYSTPYSTYGQSTGGIQIKTINTNAGSSEITPFQIDGNGQEILACNVNNSAKIARFAVSFTVNASSSNSYTFATNNLGFSNVLNYHVEIDAGAYGNTNSGSGVYKAVVAGYSGIDASYKTSSTIVNNMTAGTWSLNISTANQITVTATNSHGSSDKFIILRFTITWS